MACLRATQAVLKLLKVEPVELAEPVRSTNVLGDWFVHRFVWRRRPILILMSQVTRLPILTAARDVRELPKRLPDLVCDRLELLGIDSATIEQERSAMGEVLVARSNDRSTVSACNQFVVCARPYLDDFEGDLLATQAQLGSTFTKFAGQKTYVEPDKEARMRLTGFKKTER